MMADMLSDNPLSVSVELIVSTTSRALRAIASLLDVLMSACVVGSPAPNPTTTRSGPNAEPNPNLRDTAAIFDALRASSHRLVSTSIPALLAHHASSVKRLKLQKTDLGRTRISQALAAAASAVDDILGCLYALILAPAVRWLAPVSEGFVSGCFDASTRSSSGPGSSSKTKAPPYNSSSLHPTDPCPPILLLLDDTLSALEDVLPGSPAASTGALSPTDPKYSASGSGADTTIPGAGHVKTLLALECVRELEKLYLLTPPHGAGAGGAARSSDSVEGCSTNVSPAASKDPTRAGAREPRTRTPGQSATDAHTSASTSRREQDHSLPRDPPPPPPLKSHLRVRLRIPGLTEVLCANLGDDSTRPGTPPSRTHTTTANIPASDFEAHSPSSSSQHSHPDGDGDAGEGPHHHTHNWFREGAKEHPHQDRNHKGVCDREGRVARLARKDALWYLCAVLHRVLPAVALPSTGCSPSSSGSGLGSGLGNGADSPAATPSATGDVSAPPTPWSVPNTPRDTGEPPTGPATRPRTRTEIETVAEHAVYDALADLLRRTRPPPARLSPFLPLSGPSWQTFFPGSESRSGPGSNNSDLGLGTGADSELVYGSNHEPRAFASEQLRADADASRESDAGNQKKGAGADDARRSSVLDGDRRGRVHVPARAPDGHGRTPRMGMGMEVGMATMGEVERGMLLAVLERAWLGV
ncbi:hypothetical protein C8Q76DRAFT_293306 [Earliella scabrosa]|nr:hypothetical protein C8Q76DRAFT_293306 [Earliella scabrosa]